MFHFSPLSKGNGTGEHEKASFFIEAWKQKENAVIAGKGEIKMQFEYFYGKQGEQYAFYRIPKLLFTDRRFDALSTDAKLLYGMMIDRMELSLKNGWIDERGRIYLYFTIDEVKEKLNCGNDKAVKLLKELDSETGIGLLDNVRQGLGKPNRIYVKNFVSGVERI